MPRLQGQHLNSLAHVEDPENTRLALWGIDCRIASNQFWANRLRVRTLSIAISVVLLFLPTAVTADDILLKAVAFALTGSDNGVVEIVDRSDCVFSLQGSGEYGERHVEIFHLNNVDFERIYMQKSPVTHYIEVHLHGEAVVYEKTITVQPDYSQLPKEQKALALTLPPEQNEKSNEHALILDTTEVDRLARAWAYIYNNGCHSKKSS